MELPFSGSIFVPVCIDIHDIYRYIYIYHIEVPLYLHISDKNILTRFMANKIGIVDITCTH